MRGRACLTADNHAVKSSQIRNMYAFLLKCSPAYCAFAHAMDIMGTEEFSFLVGL